MALICVCLYQTETLEASTDNTFVVSAQSPQQRELLSNVPAGQSVTVEGGFMTWLRWKVLVYYVLKAETTEKCRFFANNRETRKDSEGKEWFN